MTNSEAWTYMADKFKNNREITGVSPLICICVTPHMKVSGLCAAIDFMGNQALISAQQKKEFQRIIEIRNPDKTQRRFIWDLDAKGHDERVKFCEEQALKAK